MKAKGNLLVGQSGGSTAVINCSLVGVVREALRHAAIGHVWGMRHGSRGLLAEDFADLWRLSKGTLDGLLRTPSSALGSCRHKLSEDDLGRAVAVLRQRDIRYLFYIGGNDSAETLLRISHRAWLEGYELRAVLVPKTIDNDLPCTDHCPGYGSVARFVAITTQETGRDTESMRHQDPVKIIEVMGRNAGWIAAASMLGKRSELDAPQLIYFPEVPFDYERFLADVSGTVGRIGYAVVVIAETIRDKEGRRVGERADGARDPFGHPYVESPARKLCRLVEDKLRIRARYDRPGSIQRMSIGYASRADQAEAEMAGRAAVRAALAGETEKMVTLVRGKGKGYRCTTGLAPLSAIASRERHLPRSYIAKQGNFATPAFARYALPLLGEPLPTLARIT